MKLYLNIRSSPQEVFIGKDALKICCKFTGEHSYRRAISIKLFCNFIEITLRHGCSPVILLHIFRTRIYKNTSALVGCFWNINVDFPTARPCEHDRKIERKYVDNSGTFGPPMTDLSKAFDCLHQWLLIAKLNGHDFDMKSVKLIQQYLSSRKQSVKVGNACILWK